MKIGTIVKFDYESSSKAKEYEQPVLLSLPESFKKDFVFSIQENAEESEKRFEEELERKAELISLAEELEKLQVERKENGVKRKGEREKEVEQQIDFLKKKFAEEDAKEAEKEGFVELEKTMVNPFFRAYDPNKLQISEEGKVEAILVSKAVSAKGKILHRFVKLNKIKGERKVLGEYPELIFEEV